MQRSLLLLFIALLVAPAPAIAKEKSKVQSAPLLAMPMARKGKENMIWMEQRVKIGKDSVVGYIQGIGGADDAIMVFNLEDDWDLLEATVGFLATTPEGREAEFFVEAGGKTLYSSGLMESGGPSQKIRVPLNGNRNFLIRISADHYNGTAGGAFGAPTVYKGLSAEELELSWTLDVNGRRTPLIGNGPPREVFLPIDVPTGEEKVYLVKVRKDPGTSTVILEKEEVPTP